MYTSAITPQNREEPKVCIITGFITQAAYNAPDIGFDQGQRDMLLNNVASNGYDPSKVPKLVESDCSALVRTCVAYAFGEDIIGIF